MKPSEIKEEIKNRLVNNNHRALFIESSPGAGKTQIAEQSAKELGVGFKVIHAPLVQPEDYGLPVVVGKDKDDLKFVVSRDKFPIESSPGPEMGVFLIDEMSQADNNVQKVLANLIQAREIHGAKIKRGWTIVATGNRQTDRSGANRILGHLSNRLTRITLEISHQDWVKWALENDIKSEVISFLNFRPDLLTNYDPRNEINATPRSWSEGVSQALGESKNEFEVFSGDVGEGPASEFMAFLKIFRTLPDPNEVLLNPKKAKVPTDPATLFAICGSLANKTTENNFGRALTYVRRLPAEFSVLYVKTVIDSPAGKLVTTTKDFIDWASNEGQDLLS